MNDQVSSKLSMTLDELIKINRSVANKPTNDSTKKFKYKLDAAVDKTSEAAAGVLKMVLKGKRRREMARRAENSNPFLFTIKVSGFGSDIDANTLKGRFGICGKVLSVHMLKNGIAYIAFKDRNACNIALRDLDGTKIKGKVISVQAGKPIPNGTMSMTMLDKDANHGNLISTLPQERYPIYWDNRSNYQYLPPSNYGVGIPHQPPPPIHSHVTASDGYIARSYNPMKGNISLYGKQMDNTVYNPTSLIPLSPHKFIRSPPNRRIPENYATVIVSNVPLDLTAQEIQDAFACVGTIISTEVLLNSEGKHTGRAAVVYALRTFAEEAVRRFDGGDLNNNRIRVFLEG